MELVAAATASFFLCPLTMITLHPASIDVNQVGRPSGRKLHSGDFANVGGLGMLRGIVLGLGLLALPDRIAGVLLAACTMLVAVGVRNGTICRLCTGVR